MRISNEVSDVLANSRVDGCKLFLPEQLDRKLYLAVNKVLVAIEGKWNRSAKAHIFGECPIELIDSIVLTGEYADWKKDFQFYETPSELAKKLIELADIREGETVLEPSAGRGAIAKLIPVCDCVELYERNQNHLMDIGCNVVGNDFTKFERHYDVIIANPPFTKQQDINHVNHMIDIANRRVVSVMSTSVLWRSNRKAEEFRDRIASLGGSIKELPVKTFSVSGTNVNTCVVCVDV